MFLSYAKLLHMPAYYGQSVCKFGWLLAPPACQGSSILWRMCDAWRKSKARAMCSICHIPCLSRKISEEQEIRKTLKKLTSAIPAESWRCSPGSIDLRVLQSPAWCQSSQSQLLLYQQYDINFSQPLLPHLGDLEG